MHLYVSGVMLKTDEVVNYQRMLYIFNLPLVQICTETIVTINVNQLGLHEAHFTKTLIVSWAGDSGLLKSNSW